MSVKPLGERVLIKTIELEEKTSGGLYIPDSSKEVPVMGEVVAIGNDVKELPVNAKVIYGKFAGVEIENDGEKYLVMKEEDVLAVIEV